MNKLNINFSTYREKKPSKPKPIKKKKQLEKHKNKLLRENFVSR